MAMVFGTRACTVVSAKPTYTSIATGFSHNITIELLPINQKMSKEGANNNLEIIY